MDAASIPSTSEALVELLRQLVEVPSVSSDRAQCARVLDVVEGQVGDGLHRERVEHDGVGSLIYATRPSRRARIILNAHLDVVPARASQFALRRGEGRVEGRGVYDMKGAAAVYVQLLRDLAAMPQADRPDLQVQFVTDEEVGGARGAQVLLREGFVGDVFIAGEPTDLGICNRAKGILWVTVRLSGEPGHGAMPWRARSPVTALLDGLARLQARWPQPTEEVWRTTATVTGLRAGEAHNRVPQEAAVDLDIRRVPEEGVDPILAFLGEAFPGGLVDVVQVGDVLHTPADDPWIAQLSALQASVLGAAPRLYGEHFASDARFYCAAGIPAFCWGPRGGGMHADDEWLDVESLTTYDSVLRALLFKRS